MNRRQQRTTIITCLYQYLLLDKDIDEILEDNLNVKEKDSLAFIINITAEAINNYEKYTKLIDSVLDEWTFDRLGYMEQAILLEAISELRHTDVDKAVVCNEAIELAKEYCDPQASSLINGVLDKV